MYRTLETRPPSFSFISVRCASLRRPNGSIGGYVYVCVCVDGWKYRHQAPPFTYVMLIVSANVWVWGVAWDLVPKLLHPFHFLTFFNLWHVECLWIVQKLDKWVGIVYVWSGIEAWGFLWEVLYGVQLTRRVRILQKFCLFRWMYGGGGRHGVMGCLVFDVVSCFLRRTYRHRLSGGNEWRKKGCWVGVLCGWGIAFGCMECIRGRARLETREEWGSWLKGLEIRRRGGWSLGLCVGLVSGGRK